MTGTETVWKSLPVAVTGRSQDPPDVYDVVVVGGGVVGLSAALELALHGRHVAVVEAHAGIGEGTTGRSTGKLTLLQGTRLSDIERARGFDEARAYLDLCRQGLDSISDLGPSRELSLQRRPAVTWAATPSQQEAVRAEDAAARRAGLTTTWQAEPPAGVPGYGAVVLDDQLQADPLQLVNALAAEAVEAGVELHLGHRLHGVHGADPVTLRCSSDLRLRAHQVLLATGMPVLDRSAAFAITHAHRSYVVAFETSTPFEPMMVTAGSPSISLRGVSQPEGERVLVGGQGHVVGRSGPAERHLQSLRAWARNHLDVGEELAAWSAQDYMSADHAPLVGRVPGRSDIHVITGFGKWGLLAGAGAARGWASRVVSGGDVGSVPSSRLLRGRALQSIAAWNLQVGTHLVSGWAGATSRGESAPGEGQGVVTRGHPPVATSCVDGRVRQRSAVCPHLGGILQWNDVECSWDCPLHGSRFAADGTVLEGPATHDLSEVSADASAETTTGESP